LLSSSRLSLNKFLRYFSSYFARLSTRQYSSSTSWTMRIVENKKRENDVASNRAHYDCDCICCRMITRPLRGFYLYFKASQIIIIVKKPCGFPRIRYCSIFFDSVFIWIWSLFIWKNDFYFSVCFSYNWW
jgi:hypothetical protein